MPTNTATATISQTPFIAIATNTQTIIAVLSTPTATEWITTAPKGTKVYPNPINPAKVPYLTFVCDFDQSTDKITVKIYTVSFRLVKEINFDQTLIKQAIVQGSVKCDANGLKDLSSGSYYYILITENIGKKENAGIGKFIVLK
jgi:hypothetical protein